MAPPNPVEELTDDLMLCLWAEWSEDNYAAGFMSPTEELIRRFLAWVPTRKREDYEDEWLAMYRRVRDSV